MNIVQQLFPDWTTAAIADGSVRLNLPVRCSPAGLTCAWPCSVAGPAIPVRHYGSVDVFFEAFERCPPGAVLVIDNDGRSDEACIGDLTALEARAAGLSAIVCWGAIRDSRELPAIGLPIFSYGTVPNGPTTLRARTADAFASARFGSLLVTPEDVVFADSDGAIFVNAADVERVLAAARIVWDRERDQARMVREGTTLREQFHFGEYLERRRTSPDYTLREHLTKHAVAIEV